MVILNHNMENIPALPRRLSSTRSTTAMEWQYYAKWAGNYEEPIDRRFHLSVAISKDENISKSNNDLKADYTCIFVKYALKRNLHKNRFLK